MSSPGQISYIDIFKMPSEIKTDGCGQSSLPFVTGGIDYPETPPTEIKRFNFIPVIIRQSKLDPDNYSIYPEWMERPAKTAFGFISAFDTLSSIVRDVATISGVVDQNQRDIFDLSAYVLGLPTDNWNSVFTSVYNTSGNWNSVFDCVNTTSGKWDSVFNTVYDTSASWVLSGDLTAASSNLYNLMGSISGILYGKIENHENSSAFHITGNERNNWNSVYESYSSMSGSLATKTELADVSGNLHGEITTLDNNIHTELEWLSGQAATVDDRITNAVVEAKTELSGHVDTVSAAIMLDVGVISGGLMDTIGSVSGVIEGDISTVSSNLFDLVSTISGDLIDEITTSSTVLYDLIGTTSGNLFDNISSASSNLFDLVSTTSGNLMDEIETTSADLYNLVSATSGILYNDISTSSDNLYNLMTDTSGVLYSEITAVENDVSGKYNELTGVDSGLQSQIDAFESKSDVVDIVATYVDLMAYPTSGLNDNDVVKVLKDEEKNNAITYYRWILNVENPTQHVWNYVGSTGPYYTVGEVDELISPITADIDGMSQVSGQWNTAYDKITGSSANWDVAFSCISNTSGNNASVYNTVNTASSNWSSTYTTLNTYSGDWLSAIPTATTAVVGGIKVGSSLSISAGVLNYTLPTANSFTLGGVKVNGGNLTITNGVLSARAYSGNNGITVNNYTISNSQYSVVTSHVQSHDTFYNYGVSARALTSENLYSQNIVSGDSLPYINYYFAASGGALPGYVQNYTTIWVPYFDSYNKMYYLPSATPRRPEGDTPLNQNWILYPNISTDSYDMYISGNRVGYMYETGPSSLSAQPYEGYWISYTSATRYNQFTWISAIPTNDYIVKVAQTSGGFANRSDLSSKQNKLTAGTGISITGDTINCTANFSNYTIYGPVTSQNITVSSTPNMIYYLSGGGTKTLNLPILATSATTFPFEVYMNITSADQNVALAASYGGTPTLIDWVDNNGLDISRGYGLYKIAFRWNTYFGLEGNLYRFKESF